MKAPHKPEDLSRREFFGETLGTGVGISLYSLLPARAWCKADSEARDQAIVIHVPPPAGPPPVGAPVETSVPFARGQLLDHKKLAIYSADQDEKRLVPGSDRHRERGNR
jgi:hypothetical protein